MFKKLTKLNSPQSHSNVESGYCLSPARIFFCNESPPPNLKPTLW